LTRVIFVVFVFRRGARTARNSGSFACVVCTIVSGEFAMLCLRDLKIGLMLLLVLVLLAGCSSSGPQIAYVSGQVTMDGVPLPNATVVFVPENGRPSGANTDQNGNYVLNFAQGRKGAIPGPNTIRIMTMRDAGQDENGQTIPGSAETVPSRYNSESILTFDVEPGKRNVANFELQSTGEKARQS
jgi:hypothetical protein